MEWEYFGRDSLKVVGNGMRMFKVELEVSLISCSHAMEAPEWNLMHHLNWLHFDQFVIIENFFFRCIQSCIVIGDVLATFYQ